MKPAVVITPATATDLDDVRRLFREYAAGLGVDLCFQGFEKELAELPGAYAPPRGLILLARRDGQAVGCVALRSLAEDVCEMKRFYVRPEVRGGLGRSLVEAVLAEARRIGYRRMRLDTLPNMEAARALYQSVGFKPVAPYCHNPISGAIYLECELQP